MKIIKINQLFFGLLLVIPALFFAAEVNFAQQQLWEGVKAENVAVIEKAIATGADINEKDDRERTPLMLAVLNRSPKKGLEIVKLLINFGADVNAQDEDDQPLLLMAVGRKKLEIVKLLIEAGADVNKRGIEGNTPLLMAAANSLVKVVKLLIEAGANVNVQNNAGETPLISVLMTGFPEKKLEIVKLLIATGANVNAQNRQGETPLMVAVINRRSLEGKLKIVKLLLENGADIAVKIGDESIVDYAKKNNLTEIIQILEDFTAKRREETLQAILKARPEVYPAIAQEISEFEVGK